MHVAIRGINFILIFSPGIYDEDSEIITLGFSDFGESLGVTRRFFMFIPLK